MQAVNKKEVSCKALDPLFYYARHKNINLSDLTKGLKYELTYLLNKKERIHWSDWCKIISNSRKYFSAFEFEEMGSLFVKSNSFKVGLVPAFFIFSSGRLSLFLTRLIFKSTSTMFCCIGQQLEYINLNRIRITITLDEGYELCPEFFYISKGYWGELGARLGHKNFNFTLKIDGRKGIFDASWYNEKFFFKTRRRLRWFFDIKQALFEITESQKELLNQSQKLEVSQKVLQKQTTQLKTAYEISTSIRQSLNINETLKTITDTLISEACFEAAFIELCKDVDEKEIKFKAQSGTVKEFTTPVHTEIVINESKIGDLVVYPDSQMDSEEKIELLEYLIPVINIVIHDALVFRAIIDYRDNLESKVQERTDELKKATEELSKKNELLKTAQQAQNRFFTNISHEFRTPLTLILDPSRQLIEQSNDNKLKEKLNLIHRSANKLNQLVDELLDLSRIEAGELKLKACPVNLITVIKEISLPFYSLAERKNITFKINSFEGEIIPYIDKPKLDKILTNILSNAFKFTPENGKVEVTVTHSFSPSSNHSHPELFSGSPQKTEKLNQVQPDINEFAEVSVSDTGIGIPKDQLDKIFHRFYQVDGSHTREHEGTGIGLSLTKELVDLHKGKIEVESEEGKGSIFRVILPLGKEHLKPDEICEEEKEYGYDKERLIPEPEEIADYKLEQKSDLSFPEADGFSSLLIVEDNSDVRKYIRMIFDSNYKIIEAFDGEDGTTKAFEFIPDIIISDIMMPKIDGFQLCRILKNDSRTSHIPVIMLTAKATMQDKLNGFDTGADEYIMKPFAAEELKSRIKNLLEQRKRLHSHFNKFGFLDFGNEKISSIDEQFLRKALTIINEHLADNSFSVEVFAEDMFVSRSLLIKKIEALIGEPPSELIKKIRLSKAAKLIEQNTGNISEIALEVGFSNPSYFAECFKKQFGVLPSQYHHKS